MFEETGAVRPHVLVLHNGKATRWGADLSTALSPGDRLQIIQAVSGGLVESVEVAVLQASGGARAAGRVHSRITSLRRIDSGPAFAVDGAPRRIARFSRIFDQDNGLGAGLGR